MTTEEEVERLREFARQTQDAAWDRLYKAIGSALNGVWSIDCANICIDILQAARLVGVTPWQSVPIDLVFGGIYEAVCGVGDVSAEVPDDAEVARVVDNFARTSRRPQLDPAALRRSYAATVAALEAPGEANFIRAEVGGTQ